MSQWYMTLSRVTFIWSFSGRSVIYCVIVQNGDRNSALITSVSAHNCWVTMHRWEPWTISESFLLRSILDRLVQCTSRCIMYTTKWYICANITMLVGPVLHLWKPLLTHCCGLTMHWTTTKSLFPPFTPFTPFPCYCPLSIGVWTRECWCNPCCKTWMPFLTHYCWVIGLVQK